MMDGQRRPVLTGQSASGELKLDGLVLCTLLGLLGCVAWRAVRMQGKWEQTWGGWSREAFADWPEYFK
jgi:hypothetical protein